MTREEIIKYIEFRASGINQAINYDYKEFYKEMLEMCKQEKQVKQNDLLHSVSNSVCPKCGYPKFKKHHEDFERCNGCDWTSK